jgi:hypothetical protein
MEGLPLMDGDFRYAAIAARLLRARPSRSESGLHRDQAIGIIVGAITDLGVRRRRKRRLIFASLVSFIAVVVATLTALLFAPTSAP